MGITIELFRDIEHFYNHFKVLEDKDIFGLGWSFTSYGIFNDEVLDITGESSFMHGLGYRDDDYDDYSIVKKDEILELEETLIALLMKPLEEEFFSRVIELLRLVMAARAIKGVLAVSV